CLPNSRRFGSNGHRWHRIDATTTASQCCPLPSMHDQLIIMDSLLAFFSPGLALTSVACSLHTRLPYPAAFTYLIPSPPIVFHSNCRSSICVHSHFAFN